MSIRLAICVLVAQCLVGLGCSGDKGPLRVRVIGVVERKAEPLVNGTITFLPAKGHKGPAANGVIQNGKFDIPAAEGPTVGPHQVLISVLPGKMSAEFKAGMSAPKPSMRTRWELEADVTKEQTDYDFILKEE